MDISQIRGLVLFICAIVNLFLAVFVWAKGNKNRTVFHLGFFAFFSAVYAFTYGMYFFFEPNRIFWARATWAGAFVVSSQLVFTYIFVESISHFKTKLFLLYGASLAIILTAICTDLFINNISSDYPYKELEPTGALDPLGRVYVIGTLGLSWFYLLRYFFKIKDPVKKKQSQYLIAGISIYSSIAIVVAGIAPMFNPNFDFIDSSIFASIPWVALTVYAITKEELFDIKIFLTESLVYIFGMLLVAQMFFNGISSLQVIIFTAFCFIGYLLIKASRKEAKKSEELEEKVAERTKDLQTSNSELKSREEELTKFYNLTVGREVRMAELKEKIKELEEKK